MAFMNKFSFVGTPVLPKQDSKRPFYNEAETKDHSSKYRRITLGVKESDQNMAFVEAFGAQQKTIKTMDKSGNKIEVDWADRLDEDVVKNVANYRKFVLNLGTDFGGRQEFISAYDFLAAVNNWLQKYSGRIVVSGQFQKEWYKDRYMDRYQFQSIYAVTDEERKNRLGLTFDIFYNKDSIDETDWKDEKKIYLNGYIGQFINKDEGVKYIPQQLVFNGSKYQEDNDKHMKLLKYKMKYIKTKSKTYVHIPWDVVLLRGAETVEFDESMLTDAQREQVELGVKTVDDFRPKGDIYGTKIYEYRLFDPKLVGEEFADGLVDTELSEDEFQEQVYVPDTEEKLEDVMKQAAEKKSTPAHTSKDEPPFNVEGDSVDDDELF